MSNMATELKTEIDLSGLNRFNSQLFGALLGTGQGGEGDVHRFIKTEAGQLAWDISQQLGPKTVAAGEKKIRSDAKQVFFTVNEGIPVFTGSKSGRDNIRWLFGSESKKYLVGVEREDVQLNMGTEAMRETFKRAKKSRGARWKDAGDRGSQHVQIINRIVVRASRLQEYIKQQAKKVGLLRASFGYTASQLLPAKRIPSWVSRHFPSRAKNRAVFNPLRLHDPISPSITFGSTAKGVNSNPFVVDKIARAVEKRKATTAAKLKKIMRGYTYNWNTGQVFRPAVPSGGISE